MNATIPTVVDDAADLAQRARSASPRWRSGTAPAGRASTDCVELRRARARWPATNSAISATREDREQQAVGDHPGEAGQVVRVGLHVELLQAAPDRAASLQHARRGRRLSPRVAAGTGLRARRHARQGATRNPWPDPHSAASCWSAAPSPRRPAPPTSSASACASCSPAARQPRAVQPARAARAVQLRRARAARQHRRRPSPAPDPVVTPEPGALATRSRSRRSRPTTRRPSRPPSTPPRPTRWRTASGRRRPGPAGRARADRRGGRGAGCRRRGRRDRRTPGSGLRRQRARANPPPRPSAPSPSRRGRRRGRGAGRRGARVQRRARATRAWATPSVEIEDAIEAADNPAVGETPDPAGPPADTSGPEQRRRRHLRRRLEDVVREAP